MKSFLLALNIPEIMIKLINEDTIAIDLGPELQCLLEVKEDLSYVLIFQHAILNAKLIAWIDAVLVVNDIIVIYRKNKTILILTSLKRYFSHLEKSELNNKSSLT